MAYLARCPGDRAGGHEGKAPSWWRSGNAEVCKTSMRGFDSRPGLTYEHIRVRT
jgi:hypothetical protein